jgi:2,4-dienoyl-CoA reductase-like NADH-dependent reductase (Old Yellow Enzyme family)
MDVMLFSPLQVRGITLRNRIVLSPMLQYSAVGGYPLASFAVQLLDLG